MKINPNVIREKFGDDYMADERTFIMGIDQRFTKHFAERFIGLNVLETCTGAGFTTISLARTAKHVFTVETEEFEGLPEHEREKLYLGENHELYCLYFGELKRMVGESEFHLLQTL